MQLERSVIMGHTSLAITVHCLVEGLLLQLLASSAGAGRQLWS